MKFNTIIVSLGALLNIVQSYSLGKLKDSYKLQPPGSVVSRHRRDVRETPWAVTNHGVALGQKGIIVRAGNHVLETTVLAGRKWRSSSFKPSQYTGRMDYTNKDTGSGGFVQIDKIGNGMNMNAGFKYNLVQSRFINIDLTGHIGKYFSKGQLNYGSNIHFDFPIFGK